MNANITPERQTAAAQVGALFNSIHEFLTALRPAGDDGKPVETRQLEFAHQRVDEAAMWAIKSVLSYGTAAPPVAPVEAPAPAETPNA